MTELSATEKASLEEIEAPEMAEPMAEPMVLVCSPGRIGSAAFLHTTHLCSAPSRRCAHPPTHTTTPPPPTHTHTSHLARPPASLAPQRRPCARQEDPRRRLVLHPRVRLQPHSDGHLDLSSTEYSTFARDLMYASDRPRTESPRACRAAVPDLKQVRLDDVRLLANCLVPNWAGL